mmetsp:Transcript_15131/g.51052  ORF Transcript_15131/g.51052 Transcript_15131/m.51052 type:complete len:82 (-) Transcript_15131:835-1080(-)
MQEEGARRANTWLLANRRNLQSDRRHPTLFCGSVATHNVCRLHSLRSWTFSIAVKEEEKEGGKKEEVYLTSNSPSCPHVIS